MKILKVITLVMALFIGASNSFGALNMSFDRVFSGTAPSQPAPWLNITFTQIDANSVYMVISSQLDTTAPFFDRIGLNYAGDASSLQFRSPSQAGQFNLPTVNHTGQYSFDGGGYYDISLDFYQVNGTSQASFESTMASAFPYQTMYSRPFDLSANNNMDTRFNVTDTLAYTIYNTQGINVNDFLVLSAPHGDNGTWYSAAHLQGYGSSAWIGDTVIVPEVTTIFAGSLLLIPFAASTIRPLARRFSFKKS